MVLEHWTLIYDPLYRVVNEPRIDRLHKKQVLPWGFLHPQDKKNGS